MIWETYRATVGVMSRHVPLVHTATWPEIQNPRHRRSSLPVLTPPIIISAIGARHESKAWHLVVDLRANSTRKPSRRRVTLRHFPNRRLSVPTWRKVELAKRIQARYQGFLTTHYAQLRGNMSRPFFELTGLPLRDRRTAVILCHEREDSSEFSSSVPLNAYSAFFSESPTSS